MPFLKNLNWRHAAKEFDTNKKVSTTDLDKILEAIRLAPSSHGLQPFHIYVISNLDLLKKIKPLANSQDQIDTCSQLIIFCSIIDKKYIYKHIENYASLADRYNKIGPEKKRSMIDRIKTSMDKKSQKEFECWSKKQAYIALGFGLAACAELKIDSCPMGGFKANGLQKSLKIPKYLRPEVLMTIGYRKENPTRVKTRFDKKDLFTKK